MRVAAVLAVLLFAGACTHTLAPPRPSTPPPTSAVTTTAPTKAPTTAPTPTPAGTMEPTPTPVPSPAPSTVACPDLTGHAAADAELLANRALDIEGGDEAVGCLLTRSGIPIVSGETGDVLNDPTAPTFVDAYVYDFQLPMLADALRDRRTWFLEDLWDLPDALLPVLGQPETGPDALARAVPQWIADAAVNPDRPGSFPALAVRALGLAHDAELDFFTDLNADTFGFDPVQFVIMEASMMSRTGTLQEGGADPQGCATFVRHLEPTPDAALSTRLGEAGDTIKQAIEANHLESAAGDIAADLALLAGIDLSVVDSVEGHVRAPQTATPPRPARFVATLRFASSMPGGTVTCGGLRGVRFPQDGPIARWGIGWTLVQDFDLARPANDAEAEKLSGDGGTTGDGVLTTAGGHTDLRIVIQPDTGCPGQPTCGQGPLVTPVIFGFALIDTARAPGFERLVPTFAQYDVSNRRLARAWLHAAITEIDPPTAADTIEVLRHQPS